ncbi:MAG: DUF5117 domain-containing protein, partial [Pedobacter sp.]|nr:DUF5117 domain-containing protein [Pedobacter sp.]
MNNKNHFKVRYFHLTLAIGMLGATAQSCSVFREEKKVPAKTMTASASKAKADSLKSAIKPYSEVVTSKAVTQKGLFTVHKVAERYLFEIPDSLLNKDILTVLRLSQSTPGAGNFGGEEVAEHTVYWEKGPGDKLFLKVSTLVSVADSTDMISRAVASSNLNPIIAAFPVKAKSKDSAGVVIDVTDFLIGENNLMSFESADKKSYSLGAQAADRSYIESVKSFPINTEIKTIRTYSAIPSGGPGGLPAAAEAGTVTLGMNASFILLPAKPMRKRYFDPRVGFFASSYNKFSDAQQKVEQEAFIHRWRLE